MENSVFRRIYVDTKDMRIEVDVLLDSSGEIDPHRDIRIALTTRKDIIFDPESQYFVVIFCGHLLDHIEYSKMIRRGDDIKTNGSGHVVIMTALSSVEINNVIESIPIRKSSNGQWSLVNSITTFMTKKGIIPLFTLYTSQNENADICPNYCNDDDIAKFCNNGSKPLWAKFTQ